MTVELIFNVTVTRTNWQRHSWSSVCYIVQLKFLTVDTEPFLARPLTWLRTSPPFQGIIDNHSACLNSMSAWNTPAHFGFPVETAVCHHSVQYIYVVKWISTARWRYISTPPKKGSLLYVKSNGYCCGIDSLDIAFVFALSSVFSSLWVDSPSCLKLCFSPKRERDQKSWVSLNVFYCNSVKPIKFNEVKLHCCVGFYCITFVRCNIYWLLVSQVFRKVITYLQQYTSVVETSHLDCSGCL